MNIWFLFKCVGVPLLLAIAITIWYYRTFIYPENKKRKEQTQVTPAQGDSS